MNWQDIQVSADSTHFLSDGKLAFGKKFTEALKFHAPGLAPVKDESGAYHINTAGNQLYPERYTRTFGYYCNRAAIACKDEWFHITETGERAYPHTYAWTGNFQENLCTVRNYNHNYFHINPAGEQIYSENYKYAGDFKDGIACIKTSDGFYTHIDPKGYYIHKKKFLDLGVFHKNFATAKDEGGWFHINRLGEEIYRQRYAVIEPFYNGFAVVTHFDTQKTIVDEKGNKVLTI